MTMKADNFSHLTKSEMATLLASVYNSAVDAPIIAENKSLAYGENGNTNYPFRTGYLEGMFKIICRTIKEKSK